MACLDQALLDRNAVFHLSFCSRWGPEKVSVICHQVIGRYHLILYLT